MAHGGQCALLACHGRTFAREACAGTAKHFRYMFVLGLVEEYTIIMITQFTVHDDAIARAVRRSSGSKYPVGGYRWRELLPSAPIAMPNTKSIFNIPFCCFKKTLREKLYDVFFYSKRRTTALNWVQGQQRVLPMDVQRSL